MCVCMCVCVCEDVCEGMYVNGYVNDGSHYRVDRARERKRIYGKGL